MISSKRISEIMMDCLFRPEEVEDGKSIKCVDPILVHGIIRRLGLHPDRVEQHREEIIQILSEIVTPFRKSVGGGWTTLNMCMTADGGTWGEQSQVDELICLGMAIGMVSFTLPRDMWSILPGGRPYVVIDM